MADAPARPVSIKIVVERVGVENITSTRDEFLKLAGAASSAAAKIQNLAKSAFNNLQNSAENVSVKMGKVGDQVTRFLDRGTAGVEKITERLDNVATKAEAVKAKLQAAAGVALPRGGSGGGGGGGKGGVEELNLTGSPVEGIGKLNQALSKANEYYGQIGQTASTALSMAASVTFQATSAMAGLVLEILRTGGEFEQFGAKLRSTLGSAAAAEAAMKNAVAYAAQTPFDVRGIVQGTVLLEAFGQRSQKILPTVANLAAAFGERFEEVSLIVGKAMSGSLEGFESLRNRLGVTTLELKRFGAETTKQGGIQVLTSQQLDKARTALERLVAVKYGDAVARQQNTLFGATSNLYDAMTRLAAAVGGAMIPAMTSLARSITAGLEAFEKLPDAFKSGLAYAGLFGTAFAAATTAVLGGGLVFVEVAGKAYALATSLGVLAAAETAAGTGAAAGTVAFTSFGAVLTTISTGLGAAGKALLGIAAIPAWTAITTAVSGVGTAIQALWAGATGTSAALAGVFTVVNPLAAALVLLGEGIAYLSFRDMEAAAKKASAALDEQSKIATKTAQDLRFYNGVLKEMTKGTLDFADIAGSSEAFTKKLADSMKGLSSLQAVKALENAAVTVDVLNKEMGKVDLQINSTKKQMDGLNGALVELLNNGQGLMSASKQEALKNLFPGVDVTTLKIEDLTKKASELRIQMDSYKNLKTIMETFRSKFDDVNPVLNKAQKSASDFNVYLQEATKPDNPQILSRVLDETNEKIKTIKGDLAKIGVPVGSIQDLQRRLLDGTEDEKKAVKGLLDLVEKREQTEKKITSELKAGVNERLRYIQSEHETKKLLGEKDYTEEKAGLMAIVAFTRRGSEENLQAMRELRQFNEAEQKDAIDAAKKSFHDVTNTAKDSLESLKGSGEASAVDTVKGLDRIIARIKDWGMSNDGLMKKNESLRQEYLQTLQAFEKQADAARRAIQKQSLDNILEAYKAINSEATTTGEKLDAQNRSLGLLQATLRSGIITSLEERKRLENAVIEAQHKQAQLAHENAKEEFEHARQLKELQIQSREGDLEILKLRKKLEPDKQQSLDSQIAQAQKVALADRIQAIRDEEDAETLSTGNRAFAHEKAEARITAFKKQEVLKRMQEIAKETDAETAKIDALKAKLDELKGTRQGGPSSPLQSIEELSLESAVRFGGGSRFKRGSIEGLPEAPQSLAQVQSQVDRDVAEGERNRRQRPGAAAESAGGAAGQAAAAVAAAAKSPTTININGARVNFTDAELDGAASTLVSKIAAKKRQQDINRGPGAPEGVR